MCAFLCVCVTGWGERDGNWCLHALMILVYPPPPLLSKPSPSPTPTPPSHTHPYPHLSPHPPPPVQVKGSAKMMVTVVATQDLGAGDVLRRFRVETDPDEPRRGNNNDR